MKQTSTWQDRLRAGKNFVARQKQHWQQRIGQLLRQRPFFSFLAFLALLLALVALGNYWRRPVAEPAAPTAAVLPVQVYRLDQQPSVTLTAKVEKSGVVTVVAQSPGVVRSIHVSEGQTVQQAGRLVSLSSTYQGTTAQSLSRQLAERNFQFNRETYDQQKTVITTQRQLAEKGDQQGDQLREITRKSLEDTRGLISLNEEILAAVDRNLQQLTANNVSGANDAAILTAKQGKAGISAALANLRAGLRTAEYQASDEQTPAQLSNLSRELTLRQLELQERSLDLSRDVAELNLKLARVAEQTMFPASPCAGTVERVYVRIGDAVTPGTPIATIRANQTQATVVAAVPAALARQINTLEPSQIELNEQLVTVFPRHLSQEATEGDLFSLLYTLPAELTAEVTHGTSLTLQVPVGRSNGRAVPELVPLDAIYQTPEKAYLYVVQPATQSAEAGQSGQTAVLREVDLGPISGAFVQIRHGLLPSDQVITTRGVTNGQAVVTR